MSETNKSTLTRRGVMKAMGVTAGAMSMNLVPGENEQSPPNPTPVPPASTSIEQGEGQSMATPPVDTGEFLTTNQGVRVNDDQNTLRAGERGPSLLEDFHFREKLTHFDHERIPERVVHA